jgi:hypothetical protein
MVFPTVNISINCLLATVGISPTRLAQARGSTESTLSAGSKNSWLQANSQVLDEVISVARIRLRAEGLFENRLPNWMMVGY